MMPAFDCLCRVLTSVIYLCVLTMRTSMSYHVVTEPFASPAATAAALPARHRPLLACRALSRGGVLGAAPPSSNRRSTPPRRLRTHHSSTHSTVHIKTHRTTYYTRSTNEQIGSITSQVYTYTFTQAVTHGQLRFAGMYHDIATLLVIGCIEKNPGPSPSVKLKICHVNII